MKKLMMMMVMVICTMTGNLIAKPKITVTASVEIARPKYNCEYGFWFCNFQVNAELGSTGRIIKTEISDNKDGTVTLSFLTKLPENTSLFYADESEPVLLPLEICRIFGYNSMSLIPGTYRVNSPSNGNYGFVTVKVKTN